MHALVTLRAIFLDRNRGLEQLISAMDIGSTGAISIPRVDEACEFHEDPEIVDVREIKGDEDGEIEILLKLPPCLAGLGNGLAMLLSSVSYCSVFTTIKKFAVTDIQLPGACLAEYVGPRYGIIGIRKQFSVPKRPLLGLILKPRLRMSLPDILPSIRRVVEGGIDYIIDDELVVSPRCCPFDERVRMIREILKAAEDKRGCRIGYFVNATADIDTALNLVDKGMAAGATGFTLNCVMMGFSSVRHIIDRYDGETLFVTNNIGRGVLTRQSSYYISEQVIALLSRLAGADAVYTGPLTRDFPYEVDILRAELSKLQDELGNLKPSFSVSSGSIFLEEILQNVQTLGADVMIQMGRGLLTDQERTRSSVTALVHILQAAAEAPLKDNILADVRRIVGGVSPESTGKTDFMLGHRSLEGKRLRDINDNLEKDFILLKQTEDALRVAERPKEKQRLDDDLMEIRVRIADFVLEYDSLRATGQISRLEFRSNEEKAQQIIAQTFVSIIETNVKLDEWRTLLDETAMLLREFLQAAQDLPNLRDLAARIQETSRVLDSDVSVADKLKLTVPIIPFLLKYEGELAVGSKVSISALWKRIVSFVRKRPGKK